MIDDPELRALFRSESEEHLQSLESGLLRLEADPLDGKMLNELFRSAHSLKGAARMLGINDLETLAHHFEDELGAAHRGNVAMTSVVADRLYRGVDAMRRLAIEAGGGEPANVDVPKALTHLRCGNNGDDIGATPASGECSEPISEASEAFKIETIRVEPQKLDALVTLAGEMAVTTARVARAMSVIDEMATLWEDWDREITAIPHEMPLSVASHGRGHLRSDQSVTKLFIGRERERVQRFGQMLDHLRGKSDEGVSRLIVAADELDATIRGMRMLPFSTVFNLFPRMVRDLSREQGKEVQLVLEGGSVPADKHLLEELKDPLMHMIRNAIDHGVELPEERLRLGKPRQATLKLSAHQSAYNVIIELSDDGRGLDADSIRSAAVKQHLCTPAEASALTLDEIYMLIFVPGFSTSTLISDVSGRGVGLDVVSTNIQQMKGSISVESFPAMGSVFRLQAPIQQTTTRVLLVCVQSRSYGIPVEAVLETAFISPQSIFVIAGRPTIRRDNEPVLMVKLSDVLELSSAGFTEVLGASTLQIETVEKSEQPYVLISADGKQIGLLVDALLDVQEVMLKPFGSILKRVRNVTAAAVLSTGEICMVLNPHDLIKSAQYAQVSSSTDKSREVGLKTVSPRKVVLLAEDSITTRTQEKRILESAGYEVHTAVDGVDALNKLEQRAYDAVISDVEMPNMDGLTLAQHIRQDSNHRELPIILVTSLASDKDRHRGIQVGASAYIIKGGFDQTVLLDALRRLV